MTIERNQLPTIIEKSKEQKQVFSVCKSKKIETTWECYHAAALIFIKFAKGWAASRKTTKCL